MLGKSSKEQETESRARATTVKGPGGASLISRDMRIVGDCISDGRLRIEGTVTGDVTAAGLEIAQSGSVEGDVEVGKGGGSGQAIVIDGKVQGAVRGDRVEVGKNGRVDGGLSASEAVVEGQVEGGIVAEKRLILEETAVVEGDVRARRLALKEGGQVNGNIRMGDRAADEGPTMGGPRPEEKSSPGKSLPGSGTVRGDEEGEDGSEEDADRTEEGKQDNEDAA